MPVLTLFGRKTPFNGDDVRPSVQMFLLLKFVQFGLAFYLVMFAYVSGEIDDMGERADECLMFLDLENEFFLENLSPLFVALYLILSNVVPLAEACIVWMPLRDASGKGSPTETEKRKLVRPLCFLHLTCFPVIHVAVLGCGSFVITGLQQVCSCLSDLQELDMDGDSSAMNNAFSEDVEQGRGSVRNFRETCGEFQTVAVVILCTLLISQTIDIVIVSVFYANLFCRLFTELMTYVTSTGIQAVKRRRSQTNESTPSNKGGGVLQLMTVLKDHFAEHESMDVSPSDIRLGSAMTRLHHINEYNRDKKVPAASGSSAKVATDEECAANPPIDGRKAADMANIPSNTDEDKVFRNSLSASNSNDRHLIAEGARFIWFAEAIYDWSVAGSAGCMGCADNKQAHEKDLAESSNFSTPPQELPNLNSGSINSFSETSDILFMQFEQGVEETPYAIVVDHAWKSIVVCIRGTSSIGDMLADVMFFPEDMGPIGEKCGFDGKDRFCHTGIFACSNWIYEDLTRYVQKTETHEDDTRNIQWAHSERLLYLADANSRFRTFLLLYLVRRGILDKLLLGERAKYKDYRLRITGHSLGGGCAAILTVMLRPKYPNIRCTAYSPPGCTMSKRLAEECSEYVTSFFLDTDMIPRFSVMNLNALRDEILEMVARVKIPKYEALKFVNIDSKGPEALSDFLSKSICDSNDILPSPYYEQFQESKIRAEKARHDSRYMSVDFFAPGEVIRLFREATWDDDERSPASNAESSNLTSRVLDNDEDATQQELIAITYSDRSLTARRVDRENLGIIFISETYFDDHATANVKNALINLGKACKLEEPYSSVLHNNDPI